MRSNQNHRPRSHCNAAAILCGRNADSRGIGQPDFVMIRPINEVSMRQRQSGFTLVEIMVVVVILAVLGALVVPKLIENVDKARVTRAQSDIRGIETALDLYRLDNFK